MSNGHIFISYRRDDSAGYTRAIYDQLVKRFSKDRIFMDVDAIEPGLPFDEVINQAVGRCEILLARIGKRWLEQQADVGPRVNDPKDFVRIEIAAALSRNIRVIPILLDGASMPTEEALPEPLRAFARRNAIEVSNSRFSSDVERLIEAVSKVLGEADAPRNQQVPLSRRSMLYWLLGGVAAVGIVPVVRWVIPPKINGNISTKWAEMESKRSPLGDPTSDETPSFDGVGRFQSFQGGIISWHPETGPHVVWGLIGVRWLQIGREQFGYPITDETPSLDGRGLFNHFRAVHLAGKPEASIYWSPETGAHEVYGAIRDKWAEIGWERSDLGYPVSAEQDHQGGRIQRFQRGALFWTPQGGVVVE